MAKSTKINDALNAVDNTTMQIDAVIHKTCKLISDSYYQLLICDETG